MIALSDTHEELRVAYILDQFPSVSETFILEEMAQLETRGIRIIPCAMVGQLRDEPVHEKARAFLPRVTYRLPPGSAGSAWDWLATCARSPKGGASATLFSLLHTVRAPGHAREIFSSFSAACHFAKVLRERDVQHVHAQFGSRPATVGLLLAEIAGLPFSLSLHARDIFTDESILLGAKLSEAEFATVCTQHGLDRLLATQPAAVHNRLHLVRHGVDLLRFGAVKNRPARDPIVAVVGRLVEKKGHRVLLRAAEMLRRSRGNFTVAVAGDGSMLTELEGLAESLGIRHMVTFCGALSQSEVMELLSVARVLVVPSVVAGDGDRDGLPNVILEAAAVGTPIVATHVSAIPEFVDHRNTGLIVEPDNPRALADALKAVLDDPHGAAAMGERARAKVIREYDVTRNVPALEALFRETHARDARGGEAKRAEKPKRRQRNAPPTDDEG